MNSDLLRKLPKIDELLNDEGLQHLADEMAREQVVDIVREVVERKRKAILAGEAGCDEAFVSGETIIREIQDAAYSSKVRSLRRVLNGTGVVLHTNLGRAKLCESAIEAVCDVAGHYSTLEYDAAQGIRGSRHDHVEDLIRKITGVEAAMVVNNNAAATMLCLAAFGRGKEIIVSRGELVEIGGSFRVPEIMEESGAKLVEVGTTNKTKVQDYIKHITEDTAALLKVHTSNYKIIGFTEDVALSELVEIGKTYDLPVIYDMGSGLMVDLQAYGIDEPNVKDGLKTGIDVILFSGDKLLGGPQGGILAGKKKYIDMMKAHPLARVLRCDKMTFAAMEATFNAYYNQEEAKKTIPVLSMLTRSEAALQQDAETLKSVIDARQLPVRTTVVTVQGAVGGGSAPGTVIPSRAVVLEHEQMSGVEIERKLRQGELPVIIRVNHNQAMIDVRTLTREEFALVADKLEEIV